MKYITTYFTSFTIIFLTIGTFNWFIDPFGMFWSPLIDNINTVKPEAGTRSRITKAYQPNKINPDILIVGNSRVEMGLDPANELFSGKKVYNQGMPGASLKMQIDYAIDAIAKNDSIEHLLVGVDFLDFLISDEQVSKGVSGLSKTSPHYNFRLTSQDNTTDNAKLLRLKEKLGLIFSLDALSASISTITQQKSLTSSINSSGFNNAASYLQIMNTEGIKPLFTQKLTELQTRLQSRNWKILSQKEMPYSPTFVHLGRLINITNHKNIKVTFFINPYHSSYLHTLSANKQWDNFELWKKTLVKYLGNMKADQISLWDFSGFHRIINEAVNLKTPKKQMQSFWEPAHYKKGLGERFLTQLLTPEELSYNKIKWNDFGVLLNLNNIEEQLTLNRKHLKDSLPEYQLLKAKLML
jgi:hypothetical protein